jgi:hypothetical protein
MGDGVFRQTTKGPEDDQGGGKGIHSANFKTDPVRSKT